MMEQYQVTLHSQMGPRNGTLTLNCQDRRITGTLVLVGYCNPIQGEMSDDGKLHIRHRIQTVMSTFLCETVLEQHSDTLTGITTAAPCQIRWDGVRISGGNP